MKAWEMRKFITMIFAIVVCTAISEGLRYCGGFIGNLQYCVWVPFLVGYFNKAWKEPPEEEN